MEFFRKTLYALTFFAFLAVGLTHFAHEGDGETLVWIGTGLLVLAVLPWVQSIEIADVFRIKKQVDEVKKDVKDVGEKVVQLQQTIALNQQSNQTTTVLLPAAEKVGEIREQAMEVDAERAAVAAELEELQGEYEKLYNAYSAVYRQLHPEDRDGGEDT